MNATLPLRCHLLILKHEQLALPAGLWALFALMAGLMRGQPQVDNVTARFLVIVLPLVDDPAIELHLASPRCASAATPRALSPRPRARSGRSPRRTAPNPTAA